MGEWLIWKFNIIYLFSPSPISFSQISRISFCFFWAPFQLFCFLKEQRHFEKPRSMLILHTTLPTLFLLLLSYYTKHSTLRQTQLQSTAFSQLKHGGLPVTLWLVKYFYLLLQRLTGLDIYGDRHSTIKGSCF